MASTHLGDVLHHAEREQDRSQTITNNEPVQLSEPLRPLSDRGRWEKLKVGFLSPCQRIHGRIPYVRMMPLPAILIILLLIFINLALWAVCGIVLASRYSHLISTAALAWSLGLRHALDADHISAIDLMTRRLIATGQRPVTVGTFFSLGHSTVVVLTGMVVAATAAGVSKKFSSFSRIGGIIGSSVSATFLIVLGLMNAYILYKLIVQIQKVIRLQPEQEAAEAWKVEGGGVLFRILKRMFKLIDRPWKMYPLGFMFGLGFDTSSEIALLGIASIQGSKGTSMWLILIFPILFTAGMCLVDTIDGALMSSLYLAPMNAKGTSADKKTNAALVRSEADDEENRVLTNESIDPQARSPLTFLYYSAVLTGLTVIVAIVIGVIQLLSLLLNVAVSDETAEKNRFWQGVATAGAYYDVIGGGICASFIVVGSISVLFYRPWRRWIDKEGTRLRLVSPVEDRGAVELVEQNISSGVDVCADADQQVQDILSMRFEDRASVATSTIINSKKGSRVVVHILDEAEGSSCR